MNSSPNPADEQQVGGPRPPAKDRDTKPAESSPHKNITPPPEARTDPDRGTGELGTEDRDPSEPLLDE